MRIDFAGNNVQLAVDQGKNDNIKEGLRWFEQAKADLKRSMDFKMYQTVIRERGSGVSREVKNEYNKL